MGFFKGIEHVVALITVIGSIFTAFLFMDARHLEHKAEFELKAEMLDMDIRKDAEVINYYRTREINRIDLNTAEQARYEYLQEEMERKVRKKELIEQKLLELE